MPQAIKYFLRQDYEPKELIIVDDGTDAIGDLVPADNRIKYLRFDKKLTVGAKRNLACEQARGEIIIHWDDDDWHAPNRVGYQVENLLRRQADICGLDKVLFFDPSSDRAWEYVYTEDKKPWVYGASFCYTKVFWSRNHFPDINVGEDSRFVWSDLRPKIIRSDYQDFLVAMIHPENTSPKKTSGIHWQSIGSEKVICILGDDLEHYTNHRHKEIAQHYPLVSCILPTYNRRHFLPQSIKYFQRQDYTNLELIILDDGTDLVSDLIPSDPRIRYMHLTGQRSLGEKRNLGCETSKGEIIILWDDDDWYSSKRVSFQVEPLLSGQCAINGLGKGLYLSLDEKTFWSTTDNLHSRLFYRAIVSGTIAFRKELWTAGSKFPNISLADDAAFVKAVIERGVYPEKLPNDGVFVYVRHGNNTWRFRLGLYLESVGWQKKASPPSFMPHDDLSFYGIEERSTAAKVSCDSEGSLWMPKSKPLVSCILTTTNSRPFLTQAIKYFLRQTYENRELIIVNDGARLNQTMLPSDKRVIRIDLDAHTPLGTKLNIGIKVSNGEIIQKMDDDDYYHPHFLTGNVAALMERGSDKAVAGFDCFLVFLSETQELKFSGHGWCAGGTLCFYRKLWERIAFRDEEKAEDWWFLQDHKPEQIKMKNPEHYMLVRHNFGHLWTRMNHIDVTGYFRKMLDYSKSLCDLLDAEDLAFYSSLGV